MPIALVEGDPRKILIPSLFKTVDALNELKQTPLPSDSALVVTYLKSGKLYTYGVVCLISYTLETLCSEAEILLDSKAFIIEITFLIAPSSCSALC